MEYSLTVIVPVFNEHGTVLKLLEKLVSVFERGHRQVQYIVVDDGSTDGTSVLLKQSAYEKDSRFVLLFHNRNSGKGMAIRTGLARALGKYTIIQDADLEYDPADIERLLEFAENNNLKAVFGSRNLNKANQTGTFAFYWGGKMLSWATSLLYGQKITDEPTCYKLILTSELKQLDLTCTGFEFCPEVIALLSLRGVKIKELPISYFPRNKKEGKKINAISDGLMAFWTLLRLRLNINKNWLIAGLIFLFVFFLYMTTWHRFFMGYEKETALSAIDMLSGRFLVLRAGIGAVVMYLPFVVLGKLFFSANLLDFLTIVPIFYSALCAVVLYYICSLLTAKKSTAILTALLIASASLMWPYSGIGMEYQAMLALCLLLLSLLVWRKNFKAESPAGSTNTVVLPIFVGLALAWAALSKSYGVLFGLPAAIFVGFELWKQGRFRQLFKLKFLVSLFGPVFLVLATSVFLNFIVYGKPSGAYALAQEFQVWSFWEGFFGTFFSAGKSIFLYSPLLIVTLWFWKRFFKQDSGAAIFTGTSFLTLLILTAPFSFWSDETLSVRKLMPVIPLLHLPLIYLFEQPVWGKIKKIGIVLIIFCSIYVQLINSFYPYWYQLVMFRPYNLDVLSEIRYNPRLSALYLNNSLFVSYVNRFVAGESKNFGYKERSWMRCCTGTPSGDPFLYNFIISLASYDRPDIYLIRAENVKEKRLTLAAESVVLLATGLFLSIQVVNRKKIEDIS